MQGASSYVKRSRSRIFRRKVINNEQYKYFVKLNIQQLIRGIFARAVSYAQGLAANYELNLKQ